MCAHFARMRASSSLLERATMGNAVMMPLGKKLDDVAPYFAIVLVPGWEHAP